MDTNRQTENLTQLGSRSTTYYDTYHPEVLETFTNKHQDNDYVVTFDGYEATSLCPITHQPDFFKVVISYIPKEKMVESKSLKLYLFSFRNTGSFHEDIVNTIMKDLVNLMDPKYLEVTGIFSPRGGIAIFPFANYADENYTEYQQFKIQRLKEHLADSARRNFKYDN